MRSEAYWLAIGLTALSAGATSYAQEPKRPNIVIIWTANQTAKSLGCEGNRVIRTPNIDRIATEGVRFTRHYVPSPLSPASRAAFLVGRYPFDCGMMKGADSALDPALPTLATVLRAAGYRCGLIGKWLGDVSKPGGGFDDFWIPLEAIDPASRAPREALHTRPVFVVEGQRVEREGYATDLVTDYALGALDKAARDTSSPFLLWINYRAPQPPYVVPPRESCTYDPAKMGLPESLRDDLKSKPRIQRDDLPAAAFRAQPEQALREAMAWYAGMITAVDEGVGRILGKLSELGVERDTLVIFSSDNGWMIGEHRMHGRGAALYEEVVRMPLLMRWPARLAPGKRIDALVSSMDMFPTLASVAGAAPPEGLAGKDLLPLLDGKTQSHHDELYLMYDRKEGAKLAHPILGVVTASRKFAVYLESGEEEAYDLTGDAHELTNLARDRDTRDAIDELRRRTLAFRDSIKHPFWSIPGARVNP